MSWMLHSYFYFFYPTQRIERAVVVVVGGQWLVVVVQIGYGAVVVFDGLSNRRLANGSVLRVRLWDGIKRIGL